VASRIRIRLAENAHALLEFAGDTAQFLGSRNFSAAEIAAWFRVPPHLALGSADRTTSWGIGVESMSMSFQQYTLGPWMVKLESQLNDYLPPDQTVKFDLTDMVRAPSLERYQRHTLARNAGILSINEIRGMEDLPAIPGDGGDDHMAPLNFAPVDSPAFQDPALSSGGIGGGMDQSPAKGASDAAGD
jgi:phage portal protein BeeE